MVTLRMFALSLLIAFAAGCGSFSSKAIIRGKVVDIQQRPIEGVLVVLEKTSLSAKTNSGGKYEMGFVPGQFSVLYSKQDYIPVCVDYNAVSPTILPAADVIMYPMGYEETTGLVKSLAQSYLADFTCEVPFMENGVSFSKWAAINDIKVDIQGNLDKATITCKIDVDMLEDLQSDHIGPIGAAMRPIFFGIPFNKGDRVVLLMEFDFKYDVTKGGWSLVDRIFSPPSLYVYPTQAEDLYSEACTLGESGDHAAAAPKMRKSAEFGYRSAQYSLGSMYANGKGVAQDDTESVKWYRRAADQGDSHAQNNLGWAYNTGKGVARDEKEAVRWYRLAVAKGNVRAMTNLAWLLGTSQDSKLRDGAEAVLYGKLAVQLSGGDWAALDTLAAAYARASDFDKAIETAEQSISIIEAATDIPAKTLEEVKVRLEGYRNKQPWTDRGE